MEVAKKGGERFQLAWAPKMHARVLSSVLSSARPTLIDRVREISMSQVYETVRRRRNRGEKPGTAKTNTRAPGMTGM